MLGRQANVRYVTGAPQLWVAGTRPFGPICEVIRATGEIHLNSTWDEGIPDEITHDHLYGLAWNPMTLIDVLKKLPGADTVRRVGTDSLTPTFAQLLPMAFPDAELVDAEPALRAARRIKTTDEIAVLRGALGVAEHALEAARAELAPGSPSISLTGAMMEADGRGRRHHARDTGRCVDHAEGPLWRRDAATVASPTVTWSPCRQARWPTAMSARSAGPGRWATCPVPTALFSARMSCGSRLIAACRPGGRATDLLSAYEAAGEPLPATPVAHGLGLGFDPPVISADLPATAAAGAARAGHGPRGHRICLGDRVSARCSRGTRC